MSIYLDTCIVICKLSATVHDFSRKSCTVAESLQSTSSEDRVPGLFATEPGVRQ